MDKPSIGDAVMIGAILGFLICMILLLVTGVIGQ